MYLIHYNTSILFKESISIFLNTHDIFKKVSNSKVLKG